MPPEGSKIALKITVHPENLHMTDVHEIRDKIEGLVKDTFDKAAGSIGATTVIQDVEHDEDEANGCAERFGTYIGGNTNLACATGPRRNYQAHQNESYQYFPAINPRPSLFHACTTFLRLAMSHRPDFAAELLETMMGLDNAMDLEVKAHVNLAAHLPHSVKKRRLGARQAGGMSSQVPDACVQNHPDLSDPDARVSIYMTERAEFLQDLEAQREDRFVRRILIDSLGSIGRAMWNKARNGRGKMAAWRIALQPSDQGIISRSEESSQRCSHVPSNTVAESEESPDRTCYPPVGSLLASGMDEDDSRSILSMATRLTINADDLDEDPHCFSVLESSYELDDDVLSDAPEELSGSLDFDLVAKHSNLIDTFPYHPTPAYPHTSIHTSSYSSTPQDPINYPYTDQHPSASYSTPRLSYIDEHQELYERLRSPPLDPDSSFEWAVPQTPLDTDDLDIDIIRPTSPSSDTLGFVQDFRSLDEDWWYDQEHHELPLGKEVGSESDDLELESGNFYPSFSVSQFVNSTTFFLEERDRQWEERSICPDDIDDEGVLQDDGVTREEESILENDQDVSDTDEDRILDALPDAYQDEWVWGKDEVWQDHRSTTSFEIGWKQHKNPLQYYNHPNSQEDINSKSNEWGESGVEGEEDTILSDSDEGLGDYITPYHTDLPNGVILEDGQGEGIEDELSMGDGEEEGGYHDEIVLGDEDQEGESHHEVLLEEEEQEGKVYNEILLDEEDEDEEGLLDNYDYSQEYQYHHIHQDLHTHEVDFDCGVQNNDEVDDNYDVEDSNDEVDDDYHVEDKNKVDDKYDAEYDYEVDNNHDVQNNDEVQDNNHNDNQVHDDYHDQVEDDVDITHHDQHHDELNERNHFLHPQEVYDYEHEYDYSQEYWGT
ncbi:hypothetical protein TREMEDRAFT_64535 [Tremella mesenterica DSM 1558]|uniref:uncharacterized protein n=1 Tax=Tremella mesenterica (strain ATCC 24925 / CBS 8224 / DSM 1558 / NBRC 9311 / NRRL Y-6157 / RJB 2259-6 / UBC 559-6) TaxID=578456 RepID=UPI0003F48F7A|nr:uncharacterized protein TREMEDRAFT_64535 [Tremella mesenterica DSM 1558]EIW67287.1 hypothetical protein TREMEDRAFT_64535 [Tremella mesenterica DSM 1558]